MNTDPRGYTTPQLHLAPKAALAPLGGGSKGGDGVEEVPFLVPIFGSDFPYIGVHRNLGTRLFWPLERGIPRSGKIVR